MPATAIPSPSQPPSAPRRTGLVDPAYSALRIAAGSLVFLGTEPTVSVSTLRLAGEPSAS
ncbi:hypothetical protein GCM10017576_20330 [Microbacterium barkeri]|uniref:Uncharacterized protein n=1 Tax=Microbacterium barkeri TaxID=33917 RepID=A0A9W6LX59_9MICO|nr:hypothetical protein [Microbacterium barkeri]MDR6876980.1 hypothetical protein [Microbacterium barkeri]GLJ61903.1 hypothetical protein GCM10017576_20330 [Microbacterium barkeri]